MLIFIVIILRGSLLFSNSFLEVLKKLIALNKTLVTQMVEMSLVRFEHVWSTLVKKALNPFVLNP
jgi:hypothetical protein